MILPDSSIWIDFFRRTSSQMHQLLYSEEIMVHPFVVTELALGSLRDRQQTLTELDKLERIPVASLPEVRSLIEIRTLYSRGIGFVDAHLLASCLLVPGTQLWTRDSRLNLTARAVGVPTYPQASTS